jgi:hypothetical protein
MKSVLITLLLLVGMVGTAAAQCPMCKTSLESNRKEKGLQKTYGNGVNDGILYLLAAPYLIVGTVGFFWWKNQKAKRS